MLWQLIPTSMRPWWIHSVKEISNTDKPYNDTTIGSPPSPKGNPLENISFPFGRDEGISFPFGRNEGISFLFGRDERILFPFVRDFISLRKENFVNKIKQIVVRK